MCGVGQLKESWAGMVGIREASFWGGRLCGRMSTSMAKSASSGEMESMGEGHHPHGLVGICSPHALMWRDDGLGPRPPFRFLVLNILCYCFPFYHYTP